MTPAEKLIQIKQRAASAREQAAKAAGALEQSLKRLKTEFGCNNLAEAGVKLERLGRREAEAKAAFEKAFAAYEKEFGSDNSGEEDGGNGETGED